MKVFKPVLDIHPTIKPLGFSYGADCFGPQIESRRIDDIRPSLMDPNCEGPETVYSIAMDVGKMQDHDLIKELHLLFGVVTYSEGSLGKEPIKSQGHIHKSSEYGQNWSTPEVYQIWSGKAIIYMQEFAKDNPGKCYAVYVGPGDVVIVPPAWAHATISVDRRTPLTFGAWCDLDFGFKYDDVQAHKGLAWYPLVGNKGGLEWHPNPNYRKSKLIEKEASNYDALGVKHGECIYKQFERSRELFLFVPKPFIAKEVWGNFIP